MSGPWVIMGHEGLLSHKQDEILSRILLSLSCLSTRGLPLPHTFNHANVVLRS